MYRGSVLLSRTSTITESFSDYSPAQWIFVRTETIAPGNAFRAMDLFSMSHPYPLLLPDTPSPAPQPMCTGFIPCVKTGERQGSSP